MLDKIIDAGGRMRLRTTLEDWKGEPVGVEFTKDGEIAIKSELRDLVLIDAFTLREITRLKQQAMEQFHRASANPNRAPVPR